LSEAPIISNVRIELSRVSEPSVQEVPATSAITSQRLPNLSSTVRSAQAAMLPLELGQEIEARVIEMLPDGNVMLDRRNSAGSQRPWLTRAWAEAQAARGPS
jgi:hypothetical protein